MVIKRLAAVALAVALVVGAVLVRARIDRSPTTAASGGPTATSGSGGSSAATTAPSVFTLVCVTELEAACRAAASDAGGKPAITVRIEEAGTTRNALTTAADPTAVLSAWVTLSPWAELTDAARARAATPLSTAFAASTPVARSPIVVAVKADRYDALDKVCSGAITWTCVGTNAGKPWSTLGGQASWGALYPAHADPTSSATGLVALAGIVEAKVGSSTFTGTDLDNDNAFVSWISTFEKAVPRAAFDSNQGSPLQQLVAEPRYSVIATTAAETLVVRTSVVKAATPAPTVIAEAVVVPSAGVTLPTALAAALTKALIARGWTPPGSGQTNAPSATTMEALQQAWLRWR